MPLHVVDASSVADQANSRTSQVAHPQVLDPAARWRQLISRGDKAQLLAYLKTGTTIQPCRLRRFWSDMLAKFYHCPLYHFSRTGAWASRGVVLMQSGSSRCQLVDHETCMFALLAKLSASLHLP
jgi:hypothetical protein